MLSTNAEMAPHTETGGKLAKPGGFQHLLKQALELKEGESLGLQSLLELLAQVPVIRGVEPVLSRTWDASGIDALVGLQLEDRLQPLACALLANGQPRHVRLALWELTHAIRRDCPDAIPLVIAPFLSPASQALCKEHKVAFIDQQGNARLVFDGVFIERVAAGKPASVRRDLKSLFTPKAAQVLRLLLRDPWRPWRVTELAEKAEVSLGQVSNVRRALLDREWATVTEEGLALKDPDALLDAWSESYAGLGGKKNSYYTTLHGKGLEDAFLALFRDQRDRPGVLLASFTAAKWLAPYGRIATHNLLSQPAELEHLHQTLALQPAVNGANVVVTMPAHEGVFLDAVHPSPGIVCTSPVQTFLDLSAAGERGKEAAEHLRSKLLRWTR
jgi:Transcriptional regulator, AbiEi antitoxin, Type IV TA system